MAVSGETEALRAALRDADERIAALDGARGARAELEAALARARATRIADRERVIRALGPEVIRVSVCRAARDRSAVRPKRCPGCGVPVVDPRGLTPAEIASRLGDRRGWLAREDGLLAARECEPIIARRRARARLAQAMFASSVLGFVIGFVLTRAG